MDGLFLAYLIALCGMPAQPLLLEPLALLVLPDRAVSSESTREPSLEVASPAVASPAVASPAVESQVVSQVVSTEGIRNQVAERPVLPGPEAEAQGPDQASVGTLSKAEVAEVVRRKSEPIRHCYELGLVEDEHFGGTVEVGWRIQVDGRVSTVNVVGATKKNKAVEDCLLAEIMRWEFPPSAEPIVVGVYPFVFDPRLLTRHATPRMPTTSP